MVVDYGSDLLKGVLSLLSREILSFIKLKTLTIETNNSRINDQRFYMILSMCITIYTQKTLGHIFTFVRIRCQFRNRIKVK